MLRATPETVTIRNCESTTCSLSLHKYFITLTIRSTSLNCASYRKGRMQQEPWESLCPRVHTWINLRIYSTTGIRANLCAYACICFSSGVNTEYNQMMFSISALHNTPNLSLSLFYASPAWFDHRTLNQQQVFGNGLLRAESLQGEG